MNATNLKSQIGTLRQSSSTNYAKWKSKINSLSLNVARKQARRNIKLNNIRDKRIRQKEKAQGLIKF